MGWHLRIGEKAQQAMDELGLRVGDPVTVHPATVVGDHDVPAELSEPFGVALHAMSQAEDINGRSVLVNGCGPIGALAVAAALRAGPRPPWPMRCG